MAKRRINRVVRTLIPIIVIYVIVGWAGMRLLTFIILDLIGELLWVGLLVGLGYDETRIEELLAAGVVAATEERTEATR